MPGQVKIPELITVHLGEPDEPAKNITLPFVNYLKNVASSTLYPTWPDAALRANIYVQTTYALNRIYTEWYSSRGYNFDITSSPKYDQKFIDGISYFQNLIAIVDELFNDYIVKEGTTEPYFTQYCDGIQTQCQGLAQWTAVALANEGLVPDEILRRFYGDDIILIRNAPVEPDIPLYNGINLKLGSVSPEVKIIKCQLNSIGIDYPAIPKILAIDNTFNIETETAVKKFQELFDVKTTGVIGKKTWYKLKMIYTGLKKLSKPTTQNKTTQEMECV